MMLLLPALVFIALTAIHGAIGGKVCCTTGGSNLFPFDGKSKVKMNFPCNYYALKNQTCGNLAITIVPGNRWISKFYQLNTVWMNIHSSTTGTSWHGRTSNRRTIKVFKSNLLKDLFAQKSGDPALQDLFDLTTGEGPCVIARFNDTFEFQYCPMFPFNDTYDRSYWRFECLLDMEDNEYPNQMCGGQNFKKAWKTNAVELGFKERFKPISIYYTNFVTHSMMTQRNTYCIDTVKRLNTVGSCSRKGEKIEKQQHRRMVIENCAPILFNTRRAECLTAYSCTPMEAFTECLKWGCRDRFESVQKNSGATSVSCTNTAELIFFCPTIAGPGNLTDRAEASNCFKGFKRINPPPGYVDYYYS